jgi:nitroreductase
MDLNDALRKRHMTRSFSDLPVPYELVDQLLDAALRSPSAGNTRGTAWVVLEGQAETMRYWDAVTTADWRQSAARWPGLKRAPVVLISLASPHAYLARYAEQDKVESGLGLDATDRSWPVPYWFADAAFATMAVLLGAADRGIGVAFMGNFRGEDELLKTLDIPTSWRFFGAVLLGYPDGKGRRSASLGRDAPAREDRVHRGSWRVRD